ncbi:MAG: type II toxin-antitoxin system antitoxin SocA domain-containing protein [Waterburya sp.]
MYQIAINTDKTTAAIALLLKLHQQPMILNHLLKMMYFIDRLSLAQTNCSLTNDSYLGKQSGLMPKYIPELIQQLQTDNVVSISSSSANNSGYIALNSYVDEQTLSELEKANIIRIYQQKKDVNPFNLLDWDYDLEFIKNHVQEKRTILITPFDIMRSLGKKAAEVQAYLKTQTSQDQLAISKL